MTHATPTATSTWQLDPAHSSVEFAVKHMMMTTVRCVFEGRGTDPWGKERAGFSASTEIDRRDWGLRWNQAIETGGVPVANNVRIEVDVQFARSHN